TSFNTSPRVAPSAMRIPNSCVRCASAYEITPQIPTTARISATTAVPREHSESVAEILPERSHCERLLRRAFWDPLIHRLGSSIEIAAAPTHKLSNSQQNQRRIILKVLSIKFGNSAEHILLNLGCTKRAVFLENSQLSGLAESVTATVRGLGDPIGEQNQAVAFGQSNFLLLIMLARGNGEGLTA